MEATTVILGAGLFCIALVVVYICTAIMHDKIQAGKKPVPGKKKYSMQVLDDLYYFDSAEERDAFILSGGHNKVNQKKTTVPRERWLPFALVGSTKRKEQETYLKYLEAMAEVHRNEIESLCVARDEAQRLSEQWKSQAIFDNKERRTSDQKIIEQLKQIGDLQVRLQDEFARNERLKIELKSTTDILDNLRP